MRIVYLHYAQRAALAAARHDVALNFGYARTYAALLRHGLLKRNGKLTAKGRQALKDGKYEAEEKTK